MRKWWQSDSLIQDFCRDVMRVSYKGHTHPATDRLVLPVNKAGVSTGPEAKNKCPRDGQDQSQSEDQFSQGFPMTPL